MQKAHVIPPSQVTGAQSTTTNGSVTGGQMCMRCQVTWDIVGCHCEVPEGRRGDPKNVWIATAVTQPRNDNVKKK